MDKLKLVEIAEPTREQIVLLIRGGDEYARENKGFESTISNYIALMDDEDSIRGGIWGHNIYGALQIDMFWIEESFRKKGYGSELLMHLEAWAKSHGCKMSYLFTMDWEAKGFYEKNGYKVEFVRKGYAKNSKAIYLKKML